MAALLKTSETAANSNTLWLEIYYTGHGCRTNGNWLTAFPTIAIHGRSDYTVCLQEVIDQIILGGFTNNLRITTDCCYSGWWCIQGKQIWSKREELGIKF